MNHCLTAIMSHDRNKQMTKVIFAKQIIFYYVYLHKVLALLIFDANNS